MWQYFNKAVVLFMGVILIWSLGSVSVVLAKEKSSSSLKQYKVVTAGILTRSGLPNNAGLAKLKSRGVVGLVNLLPANEPGGKGDVTRLSNFSKLEFRYLSLPIPGSFPPTDIQAKSFLTFVRNVRNRPVHVFCRAGNARTGTMVALYRYSIEGWDMKKAIREANRFGGGPSKKQIKWLNAWAATYPPGSYR